jgi:hypothetical protein
MIEEKCACGHINQKGGIFWEPEIGSGIHTTWVHIGRCNNKECKYCNPSKLNPVSILFILMGCLLIGGLFVGLMF